MLLATSEQGQRAGNWQVVRTAKGCLVQLDTHETVSLFVISIVAASMLYTELAITWWRLGSASSTALKRGWRHWREKKEMVLRHGKSVGIRSALVSLGEFEAYMEIQLSKYCRRRPLVWSGQC